MGSLAAAALITGCIVLFAYVAYLLYVVVSAAPLWISIPLADIFLISFLYSYLRD
jgi:hypothetical protein